MRGTSNIPQEENHVSMKQGRYLIHFTRSCPGPWPGQTLRSYLQSLEQGHANAGHTAFDTLMRILSEQRIRASSRLIRGPYSVVSFTDCSPQKIKEMIRWNPALIRWNFEPLGIAITKETLKKVGAVEVIYGSSEEYDHLSERQKFLFQLHQPPKTDWSREREWRIEGDLDLSRFAPDEIVIVLPYDLHDSWYRSGWDYKAVFI